MKSRGFQRPRSRRRIIVAGVSVLVLAVCETLLVFDVLSEYFGIEFNFYADYHIELESLAVFALGISLIIVSISFWRLLQENRDFRIILGLASGEFLRVLTLKFDEWELTESESEIALLLIKGLTIQEIAVVRNTRPGTIKSQSNAVYRKADVKSRSELVAYFVEDLLGGQDLTAGYGVTTL